MPGIRCQRPHGIASITLTLSQPIQHLANALRMRNPTTSRSRPSHKVGGMSILKSSGRCVDIYEAVEERLECGKATAAFPRIC
jgi:hypothetical protein